MLYDTIELIINFLNMKKFFLGLLVGLTIIAIPVVYASLAVPPSFTDVNESDWFHDSVITLAQMDVIEGYEDGSFKPTKTVNRAETATLLYRLFKEVNNHAEVSALESRIDILESKMSTLTLPGDCYYNETWYSVGEDVPTDPVCKNFDCGSGTCKCESDGSLTDCEIETVNLSY
jgi:hypothetical protein